MAGVIDLTAGDGSLALAAMRAGKPYIGLTLTEKHKSCLWQHLERRYFNEMVDVTSSLYNPVLKDALTAGSKPVAGPPPQPCPSSILIGSVVVTVKFRAPAPVQSLSLMTTLSTRNRLPRNPS